MRILLLGATGFLGRHICAHLLEEGHLVVAAVRDQASIARRFPDIETIRIDMNHMQNAADWIPYLNGVEAVVNCAGILQSSPGQFAEMIHSKAPMALFDACAAANVRRVVQISAISADVAAGTEYALTKKNADDYLRSLDLDWFVLRPSLVYAQGSFGGTSALRGLAGLPFITPLVGNGAQEFQPIHVRDLAKTIVICLESSTLTRCTLDPVGPEVVPMHIVVARLQQWLDLPPTRRIHLPIGMIKLAARIGDVLGRGILRSTAIDQLIYGNTSDAEVFAAQIGFMPRSMAAALRLSPSHVQDRWHARLYWLRPCLTLTLALMWIGSGLASLANFHASIQLARALGVPADLAYFAVWLFALLDIIIGAAVIVKQPRFLGALQLVLVAGYSVGFTFLLPGLWLDPIGPLLKNLPILAAIAVWIALRDEK
jgi:uncharacterized protein YbjT (DUF2867 family)